jgi:tRNA-Thr(GGU) m(6)t(6)A37 methyltransferase TsaA
MTNTNGYSVTSVGFVRSGLKHRAEAPQQGSEGAPEAWVEVISTVAEGLQGIHAGQDVVLITWFHQARRNVLKLHPRNDQSLPLTGVFATRSPDRPNPLGRAAVRIFPRSRFLLVHSSVSNQFVDADFAVDFRLTSSKHLQPQK